MIDFPTRPYFANVSLAEPSDAPGPAAPRPAPGGGGSGPVPHDDGDSAASTRASARWAAEQDAFAQEVTRRARAAAARAEREVLAFASTSRFTGRAESLRGWWRGLLRRLPGELGGLVRLFICVALSMALIAAVLPLFDGR